MLGVGRILRMSYQGSQAVLRSFLKPEVNMYEGRANFKVRQQLKLRCSHCYFIRVDGRWEVRCTEFAKHHQKEPFNVEACVQILEDYFGPIVASVGNILLCGAMTLPVLLQRLKPKFTISEIKRAVIILEQHGIVQFVQDDRQNIVYSAQTNEILRLLRSARCSFVAKTLYGEIAEMICEEIASHGRLTCSSCIRRVASKLEKDYNEIKLVFARLAETQFVIRCPKVESEFLGCPIFEKPVDPFMMPEAILNAGKHAIKSNTISGKRKKLDADEDDPDRDILWKVNYVRFERYLRDEMVIKAYSSSDAVHQNCIKTLKVLLKIAEMKADSAAPSSFPASVHDVVKAARVHYNNLTKQEIDVALKLLCESDGIVRKVGESSGGLFVVDFEKAINIHCQRHIESAIRETFDAPAVRIFRLLMQKGFLEEDHVEKLAMMSSKEAHNRCYQLWEKGFILMKHLAKTNDFAPTRTIYLYYVDMSVVAHNLYLFTCKVLRNVIIRRRHETKKHKVLIEKNLKMEAIISTIETDGSLNEELKKEQVEEVEEIYMTPGDSAILGKYKKGQNALMSTEIELDLDLLLYKLYLDFARRKL
ncbi:unnamed protein product [Thelazia callipaeda]|uniref:DNA-directed RNA polymerase III subunit RPC3 n=1 Tax=Thelazia callipaeda TaxID=103827 RepID=A0A0N5D2D4_THECL|nr:unnamed protein product [Thelazia callipaeda]